jgi:hypothetical protein
MRNAIEAECWRAEFWRANLHINTNLLRAIGSERLALWQAVLRSCRFAFSRYPRAVRQEVSHFVLRLRRRPSEALLAW